HPLNQLLLESAVTLHEPTANFQADLTLQRGRIFLSSRNADGPLNVRLRVLEEVWDLTLEPGAEVGVELLRNYVRGQDWVMDEPRTEVYLVVLQGNMRLRAYANEFPMQGPPGNALYSWNNVSGGQPGPTFINDQAAPAVREAWSKSSPASDAARKLEPALTELRGLMGGKNPAVVVAEEAGADRPERRKLAVYALGALDRVDKLLDVLNDGDPAHAVDRDLAVYVLRRWLNRGKEQAGRLYDPKSDK